MEIEHKLAELGLTLPEPPQPIGAYLLAQEAGDLLFLSGTTCYEGGKILYYGRVGSDLTAEQGYDAARHTALTLLAIAKKVLGDLDRVQKIVKVNGYVNSAPGFDRQPAVINGASDLLQAVFGEHGRHARTSVGVSELPGGIAVEIEMIVQVRR